MSGNLRQRAQQQKSRPRARSHTEELAARLDTVEGWLAQRLPRSEIIALAQQRWRVSTRQADRYIKQAAARWRRQTEPHREECRRQNLSTIDLGIAEAFKQHKLRDVAALVRLRALLDGSLTAQPIGPPIVQPQPSISQDIEAPSLAGLVQRLSCLVETELSEGTASPELRQEVGALLDALAPLLKQSDSDRAASLSADEQGISVSLSRGIG